MRTALRFSRVSAPSVVSNMTRSPTTLQQSSSSCMMGRRVIEAIKTNFPGPHLPLGGLLVQVAVHLFDTAQGPLPDGPLGDDFLERAGNRA